MEPPMMNPPEENYNILPQVKLVKQTTIGNGEVQLLCAQCLDQVHYMAKCSPLKINSIIEAVNWEKGECQMCAWRKEFEKTFCTQ